MVLETFVQTGVTLEEHREEGTEVVDTVDVKRLEGFGTFARNFPGVPDKIDGLTTFLLYPDLKGLALHAMKPGELYRQAQLYKAFCDMVGCDPLTRAGIFSFFVKNRFGGDGSLQQLGAVETIVDSDNRGTIYVGKTDFGELLCDLVQQGTLFVNLLYGRRKNAKGSSGYCSLSRVVGSRSSGDSTEHGHLVYDLFNKIIHNSSSGSVLTVECASDELNFSRVTLRNCVEYFFKCGLLDYFSMQKGDKRDSAGRWLGGRTAKTSIMANDLSRLVWSYLLQGIGEFAMELQNAQESGTLVQTPRSRRPNFGELENMGYGVLAHTQVERYLADRRESIETVQARERF